MFTLDVLLLGESTLLLLVRELPPRTLQTFIFGGKGGVHSTVLFLRAFEANAWRKSTSSFVRCPVASQPPSPGLLVLHTLLVIALIRLTKADFVALKSISTTECVIWINSFCV